MTTSISPAIATPPLHARLVFLVHSTPAPTTTIQDQIRIHTRAMTAPTATPASHNCIELLRVNSQALLHLLAPEQLDRLTEGQIGSVLHILGVTAQASLRLSEAAHLDAATRNHLAGGEQRADLEVDGKGAAMAAEMERIKAKVDKVAAETRNVKAEMERLRMEALKREEFEDWRAKYFL